MNLTQLQTDVLTRLGEAADSLAAAYMSGVNSANPTTSTADVITGWLNDAQNDLARNYYPISDTATVSWPSGQRFVQYSAFTCSGNAANQVFGVRTFNYGGSSLMSSGRAAVENWYPNIDTDATAAPQWYYEDGVEGLGLAPVPNSTVTVTCKVIVVPAPLSTGSDVPQFAADRHVLLSWFACAMALMRNTEDVVLASRGQAYMQAYMRGATAMLSRVWRLDADFANDLLADDPAGQGVQKSAAN